MGKWEKGKVPQTVLALRGSGGIKAGEGVPPARALPAHFFFDSRWGFTIKRRDKIDPKSAQICTSI